MKITPLAMPQVDWTAFMDAYEGTTGRKLTRQIDSFNMNLDNPDSYLSAFSADKYPQDAIRLGKGYSHLFFSFIIELDKAPLFEVSLNTKLEIALIEELIILSGTLTQWKEAIIQFCKKERHKELRLLFNSTMIFFERAGLKEVWHTHSKQTVKDGTFILKGH